MIRIYCWRVGAVFVQDQNEKCPECGLDDHNEYTRDDCGSFVSSDQLLGGDKTGVHCALPRSHIGHCSHDRDSVLEQIHES